MNLLFRSLLLSLQIFVGVLLSWQGMNEAYKFDKADFFRAMMLFTFGLIMIFIGVLGILFTKKH